MATLRDVDVCGGDPYTVRTRIPVRLLEQARRLGTSEQELLAAYSSLRAEDLVNACAYARSHGAEIEEHIRENCTFDPDFAGQARRIHEGVASEPEMKNQLIRVNREA